MTLSEHLAELASPHGPERLLLTPAGRLADVTGDLNGLPARVAWARRPDPTPAEPGGTARGRSLRPHQKALGQDWLPVLVRWPDGQPVTVHARSQFTRDGWRHSPDASGDIPARTSQAHRAGVIRDGVFYLERRDTEWLDIK